eukprot:COSAG02_NODE_5831_length_4005_cov_6.274366_2_plen_446_part_00
MSGGYLPLVAAGAAAALGVLGCAGGCGAAPEPPAKAVTTEVEGGSTVTSATAPEKQGDEPAAASPAAASPALATETPVSESSPNAESATPDMRPDPDTQLKMNAVDELIDALELDEATTKLEAVIAELKPQPLKVHGCIQAMDVLGQCYIMKRKLRQALQTYEDLIQIVEGSETLTESGLYIAGYAIRGGLHEKIADQGYAERRDADYAKATDGGAPEGYGREIVDQFYDKNKYLKEKLNTGRVPAAWLADRRQYKVGHKIGEANQLMIAKRFDEAAELITDAIAAALGEGESRASPGVVSFKCTRAQAYIGLCKLDEAIDDFSAVIDNIPGDPEFLSDPANQEMVAQYVEALLDRGVLRHFLDKGEGLVRDDWDRASKAMPSVNVPEHVSQLLGEWVQLESWAKLPKARKLVALSEASKVCPRFVPIICMSPWMHVVNALILTI